MEPGKLYRVNDYAVSPQAEYVHRNREHVRDNGWLWVWTGDDRGTSNPEAHSMRSVATGSKAWFLTRELEAADAGEG
jgi:hypothetical protein